MFKIVSVPNIIKLIGCFPIMNGLYYVRVYLELSTWNTVSDAYSLIKP